MAAYCCRSLFLLPVLLMAVFLLPPLRARGAARSVPLLSSLLAGGAATDTFSEFRCPQGFPAPAVLDPVDDVTKLHPAHVRYVAALGDSGTAAAVAVGQSLTEARQLSFSGGVGSSSQHTLQWLLGHHAQPGGARAVGAALVAHEITTSDSPYVHGNTDFLNVAISGVSSGAGSVELDRLKSQAAKHKLDDGWMVVNLFFGGNDVCRNIDSCGTPDEQQGVVDSYEANMDDLLSALLAWRRRLYINLVQGFWINEVSELQKGHPRCQQFQIQGKECDCLHKKWPFDDNAADTAKLDSVVTRMNDALVRLAWKYNLNRSDVGVNVVRMLDYMPIPDSTYLSEVDCFHPSAKTHHLMSHGLWNSMLSPSKPRLVSDMAPLELECADATTRLMTVRDHEQALEGPGGSAVNAAEYVLL